MEQLAQGIHVPPAEGVIPSPDEVLVRMAHGRPLVLAGSMRRTIASREAYNKS
jgi:hypothetical protein